MSPSAPSHTRLSTRGSPASAMTSSCARSSPSATSLFSRITDTTSCPARTSSSAAQLPMRPRAPVITTLTTQPSLRSGDRAILPAQKRPGVKCEGGGVGVSRTGTLIIFHTQPRSLADQVTPIHHQRRARKDLTHDLRKLNRLLNPKRSRGGINMNASGVTDGRDIPRTMDSQPNSKRLAQVRKLDRGRKPADGTHANPGEVDKSSRDQW